MLYGYVIVPRGGHEGQALDRGNLGSFDLATAKRAAQTVVTPTIAEKSGLEVILLDGSGAEIWRGPYEGPI